MRKPISALLALAAGPALAQQTEHVTVEGTRNRAVMEQYIQNFAAPSRVAGKLARWRDGVCPQVVGMTAQEGAQVVARIRAVAAMVEAPVGGEDCRTNIQIVFTTQPQALLDNVRRNQPDYLGYTDTPQGRDTLAKVTRPIQAWYQTGTRDLHGHIEVNGQKTQGTSVEMAIPPAGAAGGGDPHWSAGPVQSFHMELSGARVMQVTGGRLNDGLKSEITHVVIVAEPSKLLAQEIAPLADYITMLSLTQLASLEVCQPLPSIVNLLLAGCAQQPAGLSENDLAYLRGLYKMSPDATARAQISQIGYQMEQSLAK